MNPNGLWGLPNNWVVMPIVLVLSIIFFHRTLARSGVNWSQTLLFFFVLSVVGFIGAKIFSLYTRDWQFMPLMEELKGGVRFPGSLAAKAIVAPLIAKRIFRNIPGLHILDVFALSFCLLIALLRFNCFLNGCCFGDLCDQWYCLSYPKGSAVWFHQHKEGLVLIGSQWSKPVFPAHLLLGALELGTFGALYWLMQNRQFPGQIAISFLVLEGACKALAESYKIPFSPALQNAAYISIAVGLILVAITWKKWRLPNRRTPCNETLHGA